MQRLTRIGFQLAGLMKASAFQSFQRPTLVSSTNMKSFLFSSGVPLRNFGTKVKQVPFEKWKIVRGDRVGIINGKDKGKQGTVIRVYRKSNKVLVTGINQKIKRVRADAEKDQRGGVKTIIKPIHVSKVMLIDPETGKPARVRFGFLATTGEKVRVSKKTGTIIPKPKLSDFSPVNRNKNKVDGVKDTGAVKALEVTYRGEDFDKIRLEFEEFIKDKERKEKLLVFSE